MTATTQIMTEADTCRELVTPKLVEAGWGNAPHVIGEQRTFTNGRIIVTGGRVRRGKQKRADYLLYYRRDYPLAVVEAKELGLPAETGVQQAKEYAEILGLKFAYATNGHRIIEIDYTTGTEREVDRFATPAELWQRLTAATALPDPATPHLLEPFNLVSGKVPRYYQQIAINRVIAAILLGQKRVLATLATGTGKTCVAFQLCWKLWNSRWNRTGEYRRSKILFLADRNILVDDPMAKMFAPFGEARHKIAGGDVSQSRDMYFGIYQALSTANEDVFRQYRPDFFDLIIIDECHRGSSRNDSNWRAVLDYFAPAVQFGMTATPLHEESRDSYEYFGNPVYTYSLRQGIEDGFLAPYRVHRVITTVDAAGWRPSKDELDRFGRPVPDDEYQTKDFERVIALRARTKAIAKHLADFLKGTDRFAKTIVFCVDQEHAAEMRQELVNLNSDLVKQYPDYVCRVTADEGAIGLTHLAHFQDVDKPTPVILTTSQLLTTGVDAEMVKNVVLARVVGSRSEFKQIIGRGTRLKVDYGKEYFNIIDFTGKLSHACRRPFTNNEKFLNGRNRKEDPNQTCQGTANHARQPVAADRQRAQGAAGQRTPRRHRARLLATSGDHGHAQGFSGEERHALGWRETSISSIAELALHPQKVDAVESYPNIGIYSFARGLFEKPPIDGATTSAKTLYRIKRGQFIYSRLFAFEGAYALVPQEFDGYFVYNEFPTFDVDPERASAKFLMALFLTEADWHGLRASSKGVGGRRLRFQPEHILARKIWLPPRPEQSRVERSYDLHFELKARHASIRQANDALIPATLERVFPGSH